MFFKNKTKVNIIKLSGVIDDSDSKKYLSLNNVKSIINEAFSGNKKKTVVAVVINSPGGSPSESEAISKYLQYKSKKTGIKFDTFVHSVAASGGYWIAVSGEKIYSLSDMAIIGSIGVVSAGFGLDKFIEKHSIDRRVYTAGDSKVTMDIFQPENEYNVNKLKDLLSKVHDKFKNWVILNRGDRLKHDSGNYDKLFTGDIWLADEAVKYGLIDGVIDTLEEFFENKYGKNVVLKVIKTKKSIFQGIPFLSKASNVGSDIADSFVSKFNEKTMLSKFNIR